VPAHIGVANAQAWFWSMDNADDARGTASMPARRIARLTINAEPQASGALVGLLALQLYVDADPSSSPTAQAVLNCGGGTGAFASSPRDAACDAIRINAEQRSVRFSAVVAAGITLDGELSYPDNLPRSTTTVTAAALASCPAGPPAETPLLAPPWTDAACLAGSYSGISDTNRPCSVTVSSLAQPASVTVNVDGFSRSYAYLASRSGSIGNQSPGGSLLGGNLREYIVTPYAAGAADPNAADGVLIGLSTTPIFASAEGPLLGLVFGVVHSSAPAGVAGPYDVKACFATVR
jgi:hypothetical protein